MHHIRSMVKAANAKKLARYCGGKSQVNQAKNAGGKCYASGGVVGGAQGDSMDSPVDGMMAKPRLDRPGRKMADKKGATVNVVVMTGGKPDQGMPPMGPTPAGPPPGPPPGPPQGGPPPMPPGMPPPGPMPPMGGPPPLRASGGRVNNCAKEIHAHEKHLHKGEPMTKFKKGGMARASGGRVQDIQPKGKPMKGVKDGAGGGAGRMEKAKAYGSKPGKCVD